jgi:hypothetical protein
MCWGKQEKHKALLLKTQMWKDHLGDLDRGVEHKLEEVSVNFHHLHIIFSKFSWKQSYYLF